MIHLNSFKIAAIDLSYRDTGVCIAEFKRNESSSSFHIVSTSSFKNPELTLGFHGLRFASKKMIETMIEIDESIDGCDVTIIEVPCYTQSAKASLAIGMCWMAAADFDSPILVEPSALKIWSDSRKGDKKEIVKEKVYNRTGFKTGNDNIIDAVGLALLFADQVSKKYYEYTTNRK